MCEEEFCNQWDQGEGFSLFPRSAPAAGAEGPRVPLIVRRVEP